MKKIIFFTFISLLVLLINGCEKNSSAVNHSGMHMHNTENIAGHAYVEAKFTYAQTNLHSKQDEEITIKILDIKGSPIQDFEIAHEKLAESYLHVHPTEGNATGPDAKFMTNFPKGGIYKIWGQFQHNGKVLTVPFTVKLP